MIRAKFEHNPLYKVVFEYIGLITGAVFFFFIFGFDELNPVNINWLAGQGDLSFQYLGWEYFRHSSFGFPLGKAPNFFATHGSYLSLSDSMPIYSFVFKYTLGWFLPSDQNCQITGFWFLLCLCLQGHYAWKIGREITDNIHYQIIFLLFLVCPPVLSYRFIHAALCAHWVILALLWDYIRKTSIQDKSIHGIIICLISSCLHPYLWLFTIVLYTAVLAKHHFYLKDIAFLKSVITIIATVAGTFFMWFIFGYFEVSGDTDTNFSLYSANLNTFLDPYGTSKIVHGIPNHHMEQYEGFGYVGLGIILLALVFNQKIRRGIVAVSKINSPHYPLLLATLFLFLYSLTNMITFYDLIIFEYDFNTELTNKFTSTFRGAGRYVWLAVYLVMIFVLKSAFSVRNRWVVYVLYGLAFIQLYEVKYEMPILMTKAEKYKNPQSEFLTQHINHIDTVLVYPPLNNSMVESNDYFKFGYTASLHNVPLTAGWLARISHRRISAYIESCRQNVKSGKISQGNLYITDSTHLVDFSTLIENKKVRLMNRNGYFFVCDTRNKELAKSFPEISQWGYSDTFISILENHKNDFCLITVRDEATNGIGGDLKEFLKTKASELNNLGYRGSYIGIWKKAVPIVEKYDNENSITATFPKGSRIGDHQLPASISLSSAGVLVGDFSKNMVNGIETSLNLRGLNITVIDSTGQVILQKNIDSFITTKSPLF